MPDAQDLRKMLGLDALELTRITAESDLSRANKDKMYSLAKEILEASYEIPGSAGKNRGIFRHLITLLTRAIQTLP